MDTLTHIAVGALMGEVYAGKQLGKRAMLIGAAAQSLPDIDFIASFFLSPADNLLAHRGLTHSFLFGIFATLCLTWILERRHRTYSFTLMQWGILFGAEIFMHLFLDAFNSYGIGWFEPFDHARISFNTLFVADPLFSVWPGVAFIIIIFMKRHNRLKVRIAWIALVLAFGYLGVAVVYKTIVNRVASKNLAHIPGNYHFFTTPTAFNSLLWYVVAKHDTGFYVGFHSVLDRTDSIAFKFFPQHEALLKPFQDRNDVRKLIQFSQGYFTAENYGDTVVLNDLRFGQIKGWEDPNGKFVFHYYVSDPASNLLVVQRGRAAEWKYQKPAIAAHPDKGKLMVKILKKNRTFAAFYGKGRRTCAIPLNIRT